MEFRLISTLIHFSFSLSLSFRCHSNILLAVLAVKRSRKGRDSRLSSSQLARKKASSVREKMPRRAKWKAMTVANGHETRSFLSYLTAQRGNRFFSSRFFFAPPRKKLNEKIGDELSNSVRVDFFSRYQSAARKERKKNNIGSSTRSFVWPSNAPFVDIIVSPTI